MFENNLLDGIIYITGASFIFFGIPNLVMFALIHYFTKRIENAPRKVAR